MLTEPNYDGWQRNDFRGLHLPMSLKFNSSDLECHLDLMMMGNDTSHTQRSFISHETPAANDESPTAPLTLASFLKQRILLALKKKRG